MTAYEKIIAFFEDDPETFADCLEDLDGWNGFLGDDRIYRMEELQELYEGDVENALLRAYYGHDGETWTLKENGEKEYGAFCPNREYFYFNGYGNLVSLDKRDYSDKLDEWTIDAMIENRSHLWTIKDNAELSELFDEYEQEQEDARE